MVITFHNCEINIPWARTSEKNAKKICSPPRNQDKNYLTLKIKVFQPYSNLRQKGFPPMLSLLLVSLFSQFYAIYHVFPMVTLPGQQELYEAMNVSNL
jgi:hypothetical protein